MKLSSHKLEKSKRITLSMTSMIDVVFLLLIFFMVTSSFRPPEKDLPSAIEVQEKSGTGEQSDLEMAVVEVVRGQDGFVYRLGAREFKDPAKLLETLRLFENKSDGAIIKVADAVPFRMAAAAIQACTTAKFYTVSYVPLR